ncbi:type ISP restriction/modification enzyme [Chitinophaga sp. YIM B06452]|uniref:type ISP restriction/modification enzyme n=1 Tax=Chitinophaga sp. YIM B06452 TaxID=3082158 RepID=UPI0031FEA31F
MTFQKILEKYRKISYSERDKGERFERLMQAYLLTDPQYVYQFKKVWLWNEFPGKDDLGGGDTGIDLVALTHQNEYWAIQCKCFAENAIIDKPTVDSFLSTSSREFKGEDFKTTRFSQRLWISTTNNWGTNATEAIKNQHPPVTRINLHDLADAPVDWEKLEQGIHGEKGRTEKKKVFPHVLEVRDKVHAYFKENERGKLIMACGTGKTMTSLKIAEKETNHKGNILFLVPSIALVGQTLREWTSQADEPINAICICSDPEISRKKSKDDEDLTSTVDLAWPASTDPDYVLRQFQHYKHVKEKGMTVVFSTYQSIEVIAKAQKVLLKNGFPEFDLIICDEAHRTTGYTIPGTEDSAFVRVHNADFIKAKKRLYMTATPRLYDVDTQSKAAKNNTPLWSMDNEEHFGKEIHRIGFGEAVEKGLLTDYKVIILTLNDKDVPPAVQKMIAKGESEIKTDDLTKLIGSVNALSKQFLGNQAIKVEGDELPMKRAVAFCGNVSNSKNISLTYNQASENYLESLPEDKRSKMVTVQAQHMDGSMAAPQRDQMLSWLKEETPGNECRIITNVKVLSEGVDVPSLDAVLFLSAKNSQVDVVQSVGRVMRRAPGKRYGYIVIPVVVPSDVEPERALDDNERYKVVWTVLNALRAHDDRFNATVNKIELNKKRPNQILVGGTEVSFDENGTPIEKDRSGADHSDQTKEIGRQIALQFEQLQNVVFARMVEKVGDRGYWDKWAKDVAQIAERQMERITYLITEKKDQRDAFNKFLEGLQKNINPSINQEQAVEMLAQHIITQPIFDALFEGYSFVKTNAVSIAMQSMMDALETGSNLAEQDETLQKFYDSVRKRAEGIDNAEGKQRIIIELYDKFFKIAFPKMVERLGIVYTPLEVVDFIIHSVNDILKKEFGRSISDENIHILDPFTGTGTFVTRLLQSGLIEGKDLERKYKHELHANEIVLLAYYIAAINIENAYHDATPDPYDGIGKANYTPFEGIVLTDTFQLGETEDGEKLFSEMFSQNSERVKRQKKAPLRIIMGNPPYSIGQKSANDNAQNQDYPKLDQRIADTYAKLSDAGLNKSLYDAYIKAFRWSTDRLDKTGGIICFVSNGAWLDGNSTDGFRKSLEKEFSSVYVFNLRGNQRTSGELSRKEGGKIFGSGSRTPISITLLVKNPDVKGEKAAIFYRDIGDYLNREEKLRIVNDLKTITNSQLELETLHPNEHGDWISVRNDNFSSYLPLEPEKKFDIKAESIFNTYAVGINTARDAWVYNFSGYSIKANMGRTIMFYNQMLMNYEVSLKNNPNVEIEGFIDNDDKKISWSVNLKRDFAKRVKKTFEDSEIKEAIYRPFEKLNLYYERSFIERPSIFSQLLPEAHSENKFIVVTGASASKKFSVIITKNLTSFDTIEKAQCFPYYYYEENNAAQKGLFDEDNRQQYIRKDAISDFILERAKKQYGKNVIKEDIFYYVYGFLHSKEYRETFANDLKKMLPRLPLVDDVRDFWAFSNAGRKLAELHLNYETVVPYPEAIVTGDDSAFYTVDKMRFPKKGQTDTIIYNSRITISNIPTKAYEYVINGKSAIEWIMERYRVTTYNDSGITNNPNDWATEHNQPRYILDLLLSIINVSVQTVDIVGSLPKLQFDVSDQAETVTVPKAAEFIPSEAPSSNVVPLYNLKAAATNFDERPEVEVNRWVPLPAHIKPSKDLFAFEVVGESMNKIIPNGSICLFRRYDGGSRNGKIVLVRYNGLPAEDVEKGYTIKEYRSTKQINEDQWNHESIILRPLSSDPSFQDIVLVNDPSIDFKVLGIFEMVLPTN